MNRPRRTGPASASPVRSGINVIFSSTFRNVDESWVRNVITTTLKKEKSKKKAVNVLLAQNREIRRINRKFLNHNDATDVISFPPKADPPPAGGRPFPGESKNYLGDIVVSVEMAKTTAKELNIPFREELARYLVHGTLHLLGYEDNTPKNKKRMSKKQEMILEAVL